MNDENAESRDEEGTNSVDAGIRSQLSTHHLRWLEKQRGVVDPTEILKFALAEWVVRHPDDWFADTNFGFAMRSALDEFLSTD
jgi:hypothetical protein